MRQCTVVYVAMKKVYRLQRVTQTCLQRLYNMPGIQKNEVFL